jgi:hypothetical protein
MPTTSASLARKVTASRHQRKVAVSTTKSQRVRDQVAYLVNVDAYDAAVKELQSKPEHERNYAATAENHDGVKWWTLRRRFLGLTTAARNAHNDQKIMSSVQEDVFKEWLAKMGEEGRPVSERSMRLKVKLLTGIYPSRAWGFRFLARNPGLVFTSTNALDPKRATCFNPTAVKDHFDAYEEVLQKYSIKPSNIYNMDEQGIQFGGGRKRTGRKYFFSRKNRGRYRKRAASLELITVIDAVCADGTTLLPGFIFIGNQLWEVPWFQSHPYVV